MLAEIGIAKAAGVPEMNHCLVGMRNPPYSFRLPAASSPEVLKPLRNFIVFLRGWNDSVKRDWRGRHYAIS